MVTMIQVAISTNTLRRYPDINGGMIMARARNPSQATEAGE